MNTETEHIHFICRAWNHGRVAKFRSAKRLESGSHLSFILDIQTGIITTFYKCHLFYTFCAHAASVGHTATSMFHSWSYAVIVVALVRKTTHMLDPISLQSCAIL